ncbi:uncharacterized protein C15orf39 homolog [Cyprinodon tularosa]|uniref:uncharacterized protein C15orf39 homolog n=1 Tax=Cyprinodon tularosa TaxID=77115 RepID=UPI0018E23BF9|nr:uncharacterized protein C15orf39 homolog [Cyprinodon tularosa]
MSRESIQTLADPGFRSKMPLFDGTVASSGLSKPQAMPGLLGRQSLQYNGAYFTYEPRIKGRDGFTPPWSHPKTSPIDDRSPVSHLSHLSGMLQNHMAHRKDSISSEGDHHSPVKKGFTVYTKSPETNSPKAVSSVGFRKTKSGGENPLSPSQSSVYLAIPKPVYGLGPCCNELGCVIGHRYGIEHISPRIPNTVHEHDWMQANGHYLEKLPIQRKQALLQQKDLQFECSTEQLKKVTMEGYSPSRVRTLPSVIEPSYSSYPCPSSRALFGSFRQPGSQPLQTSPTGYPSLYAPRPTYENMTSEVYQECSPLSKYGQLTQHPGFYYSQTNGEVENRTQRKESGSKQAEDGPLLYKHSISTPREHYVVSRPHRSDIPLSCPERLPNHTFLQGYEYPCYTVPRFHFNPSQIRAPSKRQNSLSSYHPSRINASSSSQHIDHPTLKEKPKTTEQIDQLHCSSFIQVNKSSPARHMNPAPVSPSSVQIGRFFQPFTSLYIEPPAQTRPAVNMDRNWDHSPIEAPEKQQKSLPVSPAWPTPSPNHCSVRNHAAVPNNVRKIIYSPTVATGSRHNGPVSDAGSSDNKKCLKRSVSHSSLPSKVEDEDVYEVECTNNKRQKVETEKATANGKTDSPPMPVIDTVFSLAPYQLHLQQSGVLFPGREQQKPNQTSEKHNDKLKPNTKEKRLDQNDQESVIRLKSKSSMKTSANASSVEAPQIKVEKVDSPGVNNSTENQREAMKKEPKVTQSPDRLPVALKEKCESNEVEKQNSFASENISSDKLKPVEVTEQINQNHQDETLRNRLVTFQPNPSPVPPPGKVSFKSIPPHCLKLSTYNIILPDGKHCKTAQHAEQNPLPQPTAALTTKQKLQTPVRKHFLELHQSLCNLISKSVSAFSEQDLKKWLSQLEISEPLSQSCKDQIVPCLLGAKPREAWINEEIRTALKEVLERLREYTVQKHCPFPYVMRTGAVFLPMLVVKELLFPTVQGSFVDKVLQEHKVELRPTTLSEEKILIQLHKRACSSKLRRLMSIKHLPDIYTEAVNLLYYTYVCKHLGLNVDPFYKEQDAGHQVSNSDTPDPNDGPASPASLSEPHHKRCMKEEENEPPPCKNKTKSSLKSGLKDTFLDKSLSDINQANDAEQAVVEGDLKSPINKTPEVNQTKNTESDNNAAEEDSSEAAQSISGEDSWTCPLTSEELSQSDAETEGSSSLLPDNPPSERLVQSKNCSGMILKLRKMLSVGLKRKRACYEAVSQSEMGGESSPSQPEVGEGASSERDQQRMPKALRRWKGKERFRHPGRPPSSSSKTKQRSLLKIKYCPYLSACHSTEHRRRWVLRSAVQTARRAMRFYYPDLVGKRIRHLYEEDDKSEVWYRGEVLRIHEAHTNPLKTIFEVKYDSEPEWKYYLELMMDYKKGWLKIED